MEQSKQRRDSNPLAPPFLVSAPGKTIVYGEHAVVHGKPAIAAAISLRSYLLCTTLTKSKRTVTLRFSDIHLNHTWNIPDLPWNAFSQSEKKKRYYDAVTSLDPELVEAMQPYLANVSPDADPPLRKQHLAAAGAFLYLFLSLGSEKSSACDYAMRSTIPIGQGLGSSASICVCIATALLLQSRALSGPHQDQQGEKAEEQLQLINQWAFVGELVIHGNPSGVDNTVATNGHAVMFQRKGAGKSPSVSIMRDFPKLPLLLVDTCQPKSTAAEVAKVGAYKAEHPSIVDPILESIGAIVQSAFETISQADFESDMENSIGHLGKLMSTNHSLLSGLGVSHPRLERLCYLVGESGVGWTKLTGGGGGGVAITLLKPEVMAGFQKINGEASDGTVETSSLLQSMHALERQLSEEGFEKYETFLGGDGVGICYPAIINGEEIDQEKFLKVDGRDGVEALVSGSEDRDAWKCWHP